MAIAEVRFGNRNVALKSLLHGLPVASLVIGLLYYWFAIADRYIVFLYYHDMGPLVPDTSPFSRVTSSRYWMAGLVASGFALAIYTSVNWLAGRLRTQYAPPSWKFVWLVCAPLFAVAVPAIVMDLNSPPLPWHYAAPVTLATLIGVALALIPGRLAARRPWDLIWLAADGWGLALIMTTLSQLDDIGRWVASGIDWRLLLSLVILAFGVGWLLLLTAVRYWRGVFVGDIVALAITAICVTYLCLPFMHHLLGTDGYLYITDSDNFMAGSIGLQLVVWAITAFIIWGLVGLRTDLAERRHKKVMHRSLER